MDAFTLQQLAKLYETRHSINAEQIKNIRQSLGVTQIIFAKLLNRGVASLKRYEGGTSLPDPALISILKLLKDDPSSIKKLYKQNKLAFDITEQKLLEERFEKLFPMHDLTETSIKMLQIVYKGEL